MGNGDSKFQKTSAELVDFRRVSGSALQLQAQPNLRVPDFGQGLFGQRSSLWRPARHEYAAWDPVVAVVPRDDVSLVDFFRPPAQGRHAILDRARGNALLLPMLN